MKPTVTALAVAAVLCLSAHTAVAEEKLALYNWFEYMPQELLDKFSTETGITVTMDTYDANEALLASLKAGGLGSYDLAVPSDYMVKIMVGDGLLDTIQDGELANRDNILDEWMDVSFDPSRAHSVPYQWGSTSFSVNRDDYQGDINTTDILFNPPAELQGRINIIDAQGDVLAMASMHLGIPQCTTDRDQLKALNDLLQGAKQHWTSFNSDTAKEVLVAGDVSAGMIYDGFNVKAREEGANLEYAFPQQGYILWADSIVLLKDAPNRENALKFLDFMLEPENVATLTNWTQYKGAVKGLGDHLDPALASQPEANPPADAPMGSFVEVCDEEVQLVYDQIWTNLKK
ncbi:extracellular solute-binding protein [Rhodobacteraceae bacterium B1Z28]|uniref:Putrescine-binding periplasmic protein n=1 Tax=Ruegeria haliotis TaxID=2747601 RepID=A0ABX2PZN6_9RHOB|nr:extracellular solute-binding protein [Ruegeria haliotis]NVO58474.1 extracellular solute-binding protein [Ruegeria haliotis]